MIFVIAPVYNCDMHRQVANKSVKSLPSHPCCNSDCVLTSTDITCKRVIKSDLWNVRLGLQLLEYDCCCWSAWSTWIRKRSSAGLIVFRLRRNIHWPRVITQSFFPAHYFSISHQLNFFNINLCASFVNIFLLSSFFYPIEFRGNGRNWGWWSWWAKSPVSFCICCTGTFHHCLSSGASVFALASGLTRSLNLRPTHSLSIDKTCSTPSQTVSAPATLQSRHFKVAS